MSQSTFSSYHVTIYTDQWHRWSGSEPRWREFGADAPLSETCERFNPLHQGPPVENNRIWQPHLFHL